MIKKVNPFLGIIGGINYWNTAEFRTFLPELQEKNYMEI